MGAASVAPSSYWGTKMAQTKRTTTKAKPAKPTTVKMYNPFRDIYADVHVDEVENYRKGDFQEVK